MGWAILINDRLRIAHLRIAPQWAILRWAFLSPSVIRIAHPNYSTIFTLPVSFRVVAVDSGWFSISFLVLKLLLDLGGGEIYALYQF